MFDPSGLSDDELLNKKVDFMGKLNFLQRAGQGNGMVDQIAKYIEQIDIEQMARFQLEYFHANSKKIMEPLDSDLKKVETTTTTKKKETGLPVTAMTRSEKPKKA